MCRTKASISAFGYSRFRQDILDAAAECGIRPEDRPHRVVVDLLTYLPFIKSYQPLLVSSSRLDEAGPTIVDADGAFPRVGSAGAIIGCNIVPPAQQSSFIKHRMFCCHRAYSQSASPAQ